ncbi:MAG: ribosome biogenesis GTPase Der [Patescibacteria group bacterium]|nr:ribosome biogenesis GTPase Der [Patescibacteria group bacterium]
MMPIKAIPGKLTQKKINNMIDNNLPTVVIFGRTNVGKSTLFNCLLESKQALTADIDGTTRDANWNTLEWQGINFNLVDTGGIMEEKFLLGADKKSKADDIDLKVQLRAKNLLNLADIIVFLTDARAGILPGDKKLALALKKIISKKIPIILSANKADNPRLRRDAIEFNRLGLDEPLAISATNGSGTGDLLDKIVKKLPKKEKERKRPKKTLAAFLSEEETKKETINVAILGKPNVGKSSLVNALCGSERMIISAKAHTTREPQNIRLEHKDKIINFIDTAGISRKGQQTAKSTSGKNTLEKFSIKKSLDTIKNASVVLLMIDINKKLSHQESRLVEAIVERQNSLILVANKWDLIKIRDQKHYKQEIYAHLPFITWAPIHFISALNGSKVDKLYDFIAKAQAGRNTEINPNALDKFLKKLIKKHTPVKKKGTKRPHIYEFKQVDSAPPVFSVRIGAKDTISDAYLNFMSNRLRKKFGFYATPIKIYVERNKQIHGQHEESVKTQNES